MDSSPPPGVLQSHGLESGKHPSHQSPTLHSSPQSSHQLICIITCLNHPNSKHQTQLIPILKYWTQSPISNTRLNSSPISTTRINSSPISSHHHSQRPNSTHHQSQTLDSSTPLVTNFKHQPSPI
ncbi:hypothetical protein PGT21_019653 [Puccinia graminis f. sp. tritici]|uniref:Uncharacterized protein n=1 Tax=Puccinia graminis f. sp. tritici TaxID=56615 RepID=A0A5B0MU62_PUCGR|nr:hypothetical protein PGT21_019653 [Puccinia graminis f. sp. tritici]